jgi:hypothetical protein
MKEGDVMKNKAWIALIGALLIVCLAASVWLLWPKGDAAYAEIRSGGKLIHTLDLSIDREITVATHKGTNVITVKDGHIAVTQADCPDHYCMDRGFCAGGLQIVCLPNELEIRFVGEPEVDGAAG